MAIWMMCDAGDPGAVKSEGWSKPDNPIYLRRSHEGMVLGLREMNGYDDSDFYAIVWNAEKGAPEEIMYASTRGWSYPNGAEIDAGPEVRAAYDAYLERARAAHFARKAELELKMPKVGRRVKVVRGRKVPIGSEWFVVSVSPDRFKAGGVRLGLRSDDGARAWISGSNVEVISLEEVS